jgi:hypothetical protein
MDEETHTPETDFVDRNAVVSEINQGLTLFT